MTEAKSVLTTVRAVPLVFKASSALLAIAATIGQLTQHRPAESWSKAMLIEAERACPTATTSVADKTVGDAERTADRAMRRMILDRLMPHPFSSCRARRQDGA